LIVRSLSLPHAREQKMPMPMQLPAECKEGKQAHQLDG